MIGQALRGVLGPIVERVFNVVDQVVTDQDEANRIKAALHQQMLNNEAELTRSVTSIITAEATGHSWLQRNWRPLMMLWFAVLLGLYWFGMAPEYLANSPDITNRLFDLLNIGIGGYIVGRSAERIIPQVAGAVGGRNGNRNND